MSKLTLSIAASVLALGIAPIAHAQDADTVLVTINGTEITLGHVIAYAGALGDQVDGMPAQTVYDGILDQLISMTVVAEGQDLSQGSALILENEERSLKARARLNEVMEAEVTDEELSTAYENLFGGFESEPEFNAAHILVETEEEAAALIEELNTGMDFGDLARANSTGPSGPSGGDLGWFGPGQMVGPFDEAVQTMQVGEVAGPVQTQFGWHVIKLNDTRMTEAPSLEEAREQLSQVIVQERATTLIEERREAATIEMSEVEIDPEIVKDTSLIGR